MKKKLFPIFFFLCFSITLFFVVSCTPEGPSLPGAAPPEGYFAVTATAGEHGSIDPSGEISVPIGESITLKIIPDIYYKIKEVFVNGVSEGAIDTLVLTVTGGSANFTVHATFKGKQEVRIDGQPYVYETINSALNVAESSETIVVYPGIYNEHVVLHGKNIVLKGCDPADPSIVADTIIDGGASHSVITCSGDDVSTITGLTIRNGGYTDHGGGINIYRCSPAIINNIIINNTALISGGGIYMEYSDATIIGNTISNNQSQTGTGGGINIFFDSSPIIRKNIITENTTNHGGGIYIYDSSPIIGGSDSGDTGNFNYIYDNIPDEVSPDNYPYNYFSNE